MKRRAFIAGLSGAATWAIAARAQQLNRVRRVGLLRGAANVEALAEIGAFRESLAKLGWVEGRNLQVDVRFAAGDLDYSFYATELVKLGSDAIVAFGGGATRAVQEKTQTIPIVSIGAGEVSGVSNVAHPEGNITGVANLFYSFGGKWLELLKEAVPRLEKVAYMPPTGFFPSIADAAHVLGVQAIEIPYSNTVDFVHRVDAFATNPNAGLIVPPASFAQYYEMILILAAQHRLPTVVGNLPRKGALICYGPNFVDLFRRGASIVDHILRGAKVSELPVEYPTKLELTVNLKTAKALGLTVPETLLVRADEVIQ
jgi:putative tryptophan/tyrosine transport system substrate-binding protein